MNFPDISEYYKGDLAVAEDKAWAETKYYVKYANILLPVLQDIKATSVLEIGCGAGWLLAALPAEYDYLGIDKNETFLQLATQRYQSPTRRFLRQDIRELSAETLLTSTKRPFDVVCCFAVLKHFGLREWDAILTRILSLAPRACIEVQLYPTDRDDGTDFHHTFVTRQRLEGVIRRAGCRFLGASPVYEGPLDGQLMQATVIHVER